MTNNPSLDLVEFTLDMARKTGADLDMAYTIAAYHDLGLSGPRAVHHLAGGKILMSDARLKRWFSTEQLQMMKEAVEDHRASASRSPRSIYGKIVAEADRDIEPETVIREKERLCIARSAIAVQKTNLYEKPHLIHYLTSIDGALMIDTDCCCPCIGAILDGDAVTIGSPARGARYNSTVNYISRRRQLGQSFTGIVVSEDGTVDAVTDQRIIRLNLTN